MGDTEQQASAAPGDAAARAFIARWQGVTASELSTAQSFVRELCDLLAVELPHPTPEQGYMFERPVTFAYDDGSTTSDWVLLSRVNSQFLKPEILDASYIIAPQPGWRLWTDDFNNLVQVMK